MSETIKRPNKAILLARVSDARQDSEDAQLMNMRQFAAQFGFKKLDERKIKESSTKADRKKFQEIIAEIKASKEPVALIVDTVDRLQRSFRESVLLDDLKRQQRVELYFQRENLVIRHDSNSTDLMRWDMAVMFARNYVLQLGDNVKRKFKLMRAENMKTGPANFCYKPVHEINALGKPKRIDIVPDPETAPLIIQAFELFATGQYSISTLTKEMQRRGLKGKKKGKPITDSVMHFTLDNPFYYGIMRTKEGEMPHRYETLISKELFMKVQKIRHGRRKNPSKMIAKEFIFRGLVHCSNPKCGCLYSPEIKKDKYIYYSCTNAKDVCERVYVNEKVFLKTIYEALDSIQLPEKRADELVDALKKNLDSKSLFQKNEVNRLRREYDKLQNEIDGLTKKYALEEISKELYDRILTANKERQREIETELSQHTEADENYHITAARIIDVARRARKIFDSSEVAEKNQFLQFILQNPRADGKANIYNAITLQRVRPNERTSKRAAGLGLEPR